MSAVVTTVFVADPALGLDPRVLDFTVIGRDMQRHRHQELIEEAAGESMLDVATLREALGRNF